MDLNGFDEAKDDKKKTSGGRGRSLSCKDDILGIVIGRSMNKRRYFL